jgi:hypothetical protein
MMGAAMNNEPSPSTQRSWIQADGFCDPRYITLIIEERITPTSTFLSGRMFGLDVNQVGEMLERYIASVRPELRGGSVVFYRLCPMTRQWEVGYTHPGLQPISIGVAAPKVRLAPLRAGESVDNLQGIDTNIPWREGYNVGKGWFKSEHVVPLHDVNNWGTLDVKMIDRKFVVYSREKATGLTNLPTREETKEELSPPENEGSSINVRIADVNPDDPWEPPAVREEPPT